MKEYHLSRVAEDGRTIIAELLQKIPEITENLSWERSVCDGCWFVEVIHGGNIYSYITFGSISELFPYQSYERNTSANEAGPASPQMVELITTLVEFSTLTIDNGQY